MTKQIFTGVTLAGALLAFGCGNDRDSFNDVVLAPTSTATITTTTRTTTSSTTSQSTTSTTSTTSTATNTVPANALYIQPGGAAGGSGSQSAPFNSIGAAVAAAPTGAFLYVLPAANNAVINESFTLKDGQQLVGKGAPSVAASGKLQARVIANNTYPRLSGTVTLGNNNFVSGFEFVSPTGSAIQGSGINSANLNNIKVTGAGAVAVNLVRVSGTVSLTDSDIEAGTSVFAGDLVRIRTDEFSSENDATTAETAAGAAGTANITVTGNTLLGDGLNTEFGVLVGQDEASGATNRTATRLSTVNVSNNEVRFVTTAGIGVQSYDEVATITVNGNTVEYSRAGILEESLGNVSSQDALTATGNTVKTFGSTIRAELAHLSSANINNNNVAANVSYGAIAPTVQPPAVAQADSDAGNIFVSTGPASVLDVNSNTIQGSTTPIYLNLSANSSTEAATGVTRVLTNTITRYGANNNQIYVQFAATGAGAAQRLAVRNNIATNSSLFIQATDNAITANLSLLANQVNQMSFNLPTNPNPTVKAELAGNNGDTLFTSTAAANVSPNATPVVIVGGTLGTLGANGAAI